MKPKVKIIEIQGSAISLESQINQFLQNIDVDNFIDIKLNTLERINSSSPNDSHIALIMYLE
jgi:Sporulation protein Cse60